MASSATTGKIMDMSGNTIDKGYIDVAGESTTTGTDPYALPIVANPSPVLFTVGTLQVTQKMALIGAGAAVVLYLLWRSR